MKRHIALIAAALALAGCQTGTSETATTSASAEQQLTTAELKALLPGKTVSFSPGGTAIYNTDGSYEFRGGRGTERGRYRISNGRVCVTFTSRYRRCDAYFKSGGRYIFVNGRGQRFPARIR